MDSPNFQSSVRPSRTRTDSTFSYQSVDSHGAIRKRTVERARSISASHADRLHRLALDQAAELDSQSIIPPSSGIHWITPQQSPEPHDVFADPSIETFPAWTVPTPPHSDSGVPVVSIETNDDAIPVISSSSQDFNFDQPTSSTEMSSLGFLLPSQYGSSFDEPINYGMDQNYIPPMRMSQPPASSATTAYSQTVSSSPSLYQSKTLPEASAGSRRQSELPSITSAETSYDPSYRRISSLYDSPQSTPYTMASGQTIPSISGLTHSPLPSPHIGGSPNPSSLSQYNTSAARLPSMYDSGSYSYSSAGSGQSQYPSTQSISYPSPYVGSNVNDVLVKPIGSDSSMRVLNQRPKPQCWEHGCNGRQFSTFSNLLRHQREKSGSAAKSYCPKCGAEFTRTTARNGHLAHDKCSKQRRQSEDKQ